MKSTTRATLAALLLSSATLVAAQTPAQKFADQFRVWQSYTGGAPYQLTTPKFSNKPDDPSTGLTTREMQSLSSGAPAWRLSQPSVSSGPTFAQMNPHGLPFDYYQAAASNSDALKYLTSAGEPALATASSDNMLSGHQSRGWLHRTRATIPLIPPL